MDYKLERGYISHPIDLNKYNVDLPNYDEYWNTKEEDLIRIEQNMHDTFTFCAGQFNVEKPDFDSCYQKLLDIDKQLLTKFSALKNAPALQDLRQIDGECYAKPADILQFKIMTIDEWLSLTQEQKQLFLNRVQTAYSCSNIDFPFSEEVILKSEKKMSEYPSDENIRTVFLEAL